MDVAAELRRARHRAALSQRELAARAGTSQATLSAYESGRKVPTVATLERLLAATGGGLHVAHARRTPEQLRRSGQILEDLLDFADYLPFRRTGALSQPLRDARA